MALNTVLQVTRKGGASDGQSFFASGDQRNDVLVAQGGAPYTEMARSGGIWNVISAATAPIAAIPGTAAIIEIFNNSGATTQPFVMEVIDLFLFNLLSTAIIHNPAIWAEVTAPKAAPSTASLVINSQSGRLQYTSTAATRIGTGAATTVGNVGWRPFGLPVTPALETATVGTAWSAPVQGQLYVPPGCSLCLTATDTTATGTVQIGATWNEVIMTATSTIG